MGQTSPWETVYSVDDYFDGPRVGAADFFGAPHAFKCDWNAAADDWDESFSLNPIKPEELALIREGYSIFERWRAAHDAGTLLPNDAHPALEVERARYNELQPIVANILRVDSPSITRVFPSFQGKMFPLAMQVQWTRT